MRTFRPSSFSNIDKFSTAGLVTRMTTDVTKCRMHIRCCYVCASVHRSGPDLRHADGVSDQRESGKHLSGGSGIFGNHHDFHYEKSIEIL